ncbi:MAG: hypothetical protein KF760_14235 [Candidatus Eremiobacteraeota bacterium]|nr:hypothetical protein [Candidatus Eremiobacteraeota bacterium]MCW5871139.1 hypothetical protein [Candidatus Eremiobacteraeota bacterium]
MEVERNLLQSPLSSPVRTRASKARKSAPPSLDRVQTSESLEHVACRVLFRRLPELLSRMVATSQEPGQVTFVFRLGYFDMAGLSQARKEFFQETRTGMRIMVEVPDELPGESRQSLHLKVTPGNLKRLARRAAAQVRSERLDGAVKTRSSAVVTVTSAPEVVKAPQGREEVSPVLRHLVAVVKGEEGRKLDLRSPAPPPLKPWLRSASKKKKQVPFWLRRREQVVWREPRHIGPKAAENAHSAERQPHCLCPACGREMESTLLYCPECTMRAARYIRIPEARRCGQSPQSLSWLLSQVVSCR